MVSKQAATIEMADMTATDSLAVDTTTVPATTENSAAVDADGKKPKALSKSVLKRFAINVASLFSVHAANMLLPLLTVPYVVRIIGPERLGLLNFSQAYVAYFTLLINYGFDTAAVRSIAADRNNKALINRIFSEVIVGKALLWVLSTVIFSIVSFSVPEFKEHLVLHVCTYLSCVGIVLFPVWLYQAMEDLGRVAVFNLVVKLLFTLTVFLVIRQPNDYVYQNLSLSLAQVLISVVAFRTAIRRFDITFSWPALSALAERFRDNRILFFTSVVATIYAGSNIFLLGLFSTAFSVGIFSAGTRIVGIVQAFVSLALNQAFFPIVASAFGQGREKGLRVVQTVFFPVTVLMLLLSAAIWLIAPYFIQLFYGSKFQEAILVLRIVALLPITLGLNNLLGVHTMLSLKMDKPFFRITAAGSVISLSLNALLIQRYSHVGVACSWVITEAFVTLGFYVYLRYKGVQVIQLKYIQEAVSFTKNRIAILFKF